jgi:oxygen-independent coproporphyrinogen-3 oxidase
MHEWIGLGPSAASQYDGYRGANIADLEEWMKRVGRNERATEDRVKLSPELLVEDSLIFGLRTNHGVNLATLQDRFPQAPWAAVADLASRLAAEGLATLTGAQLQLTLKGRLIADAIGSEIMDALSTQT